ncbi:MAG: hypothetical protein M3Q07_02180, partial [Pseudobdellovibrionaceae bacterium]|nr:hypothetical protein [Pseudobdellovibrionaceae bacterium]
TVLWDAAAQCETKPSGAHANCKAMPLGTTKTFLSPDKPTSSENAFIKTMAYQNVITYTYNCGGRYDPTYLTVDNWKLALPFTPSDSLTHTFASQDMKDYELIRESRGFSTISRDCKLVITGNDTYPAALPGLKLYVTMQVDTLNAYTNTIKAITSVGSVTSIVDSLNGAINIFDKEVSKLMSDIESTQLDLDLESEPAKLDELKLKLAGLEADKLEREQTRKNLIDSRDKVSVDCAEGKCEAALSSVKELVEGYSKTLSEDIQNNVFPWFKGEIERLKTKDEEISKKLAAILKFVQSKLPNNSQPEA